MSFYGSSFSFDGISSEELGLMLYDFNTTSQGNSSFASGFQLNEERIPHKVRSLYYGGWLADNLEFTLVFGADEYSAMNHEDIDRQEMELIGSWLTGKSGYKWLSIDQDDMAGVRYRCIMTDLKMIEYSGFKWALQCTAHCDSPFGHTFPQEFNVAVSGESSALIRSRSSYNGLYYPNMEIVLSGGGSFSITNQEASSNFALTDYPNADTIYIDGENGIMRSAAGINVYQYCNFIFPSLIRGDNHISFSGNGSVKYICEFPVNVGG